MTAGSSTTMAVRAGETVAGKYVVERVLGEGGMGVVVLAMHTQLEQKVAIKFLKAEALQSTEAVARFVREARAAARIQSEHVVRVFDVATLETGEPYLVMEYLEGRDLDSEIRARGPLPVDEVVTFILEACEALAQAHKAGIIHRDLKPANLFLALQPDETTTVKILDFGISKLTPKPGGADAISMTRTSAVMGSPLYMAPEQMRSTRAVDVRADIWSLGIVLYEALTGEPPFVAESLTEVCAMILTESPPAISLRRPDVPPQLEAVVAKCLEKMPAGRYADVADLAAALAPFAPPDVRILANRVARVLRGSAALRSQRALADTHSALGPALGSISEGSAVSSSGALPAVVAAAVGLPDAAISQATLAPHPPHPAHPVVATLATFGRTDGESTKPKSIIPYVIGGLVGVLAIVLVTILAVTHFNTSRVVARAEDPIPTAHPSDPAAISPTTAMSEGNGAAAAPTIAPAASSVVVVAVVPPEPPAPEPTTRSTGPTTRTKPATTPTTKPTVAASAAAAGTTTSTTSSSGSTSGAGSTSTTGSQPSAATKPAPLSTTGFGGRE
jgi:eukaryotic-like serine/threonine-protein kinase